MRSDDLTKAQCRALSNKLAGMLGYLGRLKKRMTSRGFPHNDPLLQLVLTAEDAMHRLRVDVHYRSIEGQGMPGNLEPPKFESGRPPRRPRRER
jgi:hypothetical protein